MRIQHNILAMNSYRNYTNNSNALGKNLEKLSSGYKINRAGDDAAGLAISEKMRAQIQGLNAAQKNVKDGISLVKTAEGAMQEIQDMMSRMKYLATQSANGTYDNEVDRQALQDEVNQLKEEINRIADSANFNGIKLLDGSLGGGASSSSSAGVDVALTATGSKTALSDGTATPQVTEATLEDLDGLSEGDKLTLTLEMTDGTKYSFDLTVKSGKLQYKGEDILAQPTDASTEVTDAEVSAILAELLQKDESFSDKFTADGSSATFKLTSAEGGFGDPSIKVISAAINGKNVSNVAGSVTTDGTGEYQVLDVSQMQVYDASDDSMKASDSIITINGQQFAFAKDAESAKALGPDVNVVIGAAANAQDLVDLINQKLGTNIDDPTGTTIDLISKGGIDSASGSSSGGGLTLQIGDTSDSFNQLVVSVNDMHYAAIGISSVDISSIGGAQAAIDLIKDGINYVSSTRGTLGAIQNRLEHTQNNLSVMAENIQDAESTIRDTDVAEEMMGYVKNNILIQSAQAMLAQANQVPQGVLQLLG